MGDPYDALLPLRAQMLRARSEDLRRQALAIRRQAREALARSVHARSMLDGKRLRPDDGADLTALTIDR